MLATIGTWCRLWPYFFKDLFIYSHILVIGKVFLILFFHFWKKSPPKKMMSSKDSLFCWGSYNSTTFFLFYSLPPKRVDFWTFGKGFQYHLPKIEHLHSCKQAIVNLYLSRLPQVCFPSMLLKEKMKRGLHNSRIVYVLLFFTTWRSNVSYM